MTSNHVLTAAEFDGIATGDPDAAAVGKLLAAVLSRRVVMLQAILRQLAERCPAALPPFEAAYDVLATAQAADPAAVQTVLTHPSVGVWASGCLRYCQCAGTGFRPVDDMRQLAAIAAAAAIRARHAFRLDVPLRDGVVMLPTLGQAAFRGATGQSATVAFHHGHTSITAGGLSIAVPQDPATDAEGWHGLRTLRSRAAGLDIALHLEDLDPCWNGAEARAPRCDNSGFRAWQSLLDSTWEILAGQYPRRAGALAVGLRAIVPLQPPDDRSGISVSTADAFGAICMTPPADPLRFADSLIHEFHHSVLYALAGCCRLHDAGPEAEHYSPWRGDPRPFDGIMHGAYAFLGVADFWRGQRATLTGPDLRVADYEFARWRDEVAQAAAVLLGSGMLTPSGTALVQGMAATASRWLGLPVEDEAAAMAGRLATDHRFMWRLRNRRPDPGAIGAITDAWLAGQPCPVNPCDVAATTASQSRQLPFSGRVRPCSQQLRTPEAMDQAEGSPADLAYARDDFAAALLLYQAAIEADPQDADAWAGLALTLTASGEVGGIAATPEVARAVYLDAVGRAGTPSIEALDRWLGQSVVAIPLSAGT